MKQFDTLTDDELVALTPEQIAHYIDLDCAERGFPLLPPEPVKPEIPTFEPDLEVYQLGTSTYSIMATFTDKEEAHTVAEEMNDCDRCETSFVAGWQGPKQIGRVNVDPVVVMPMKVFSEAKAAELRSKIQAASELQKSYDEDRLAYDKAKNARTSSVERITERIEEVFKRDRKRARRREQFARYLELADGNAHTAVKFLVNAEPDTFELLPELKEVHDLRNKLYPEGGQNA